MSSPNRSLLLLCFLTIPRVCSSQTVGATFGDVVRLSGTPSDIVLDESRSRLYLVNANTGQVDIYNYANKNLAGSIRVGSTPGRVTLTSFGVAASHSSVAALREHR